MKKQLSAVKDTARPVLGRLMYEECTEGLSQEASGQVRISLESDSFPIEAVPDIETLNVQDIVGMPVALTKAVIHVMIDRIRHLSTITSELPSLKAELKGKLKEKGNLRTDSDTLLNTLATTVKQNNETIEKLLIVNKELKQATRTQKELLQQDESELTDLTGKLKGLATDSPTKPALQLRCSELDRKLQELRSKNSAIEQETVASLAALEQKSPGQSTTVLPPHNSLCMSYSKEYDSLHNTLSCLSQTLSITDLAVTSQTNNRISLKRECSHALEQEESSLHETDHLLSELDRETLHSETLLLSYRTQQEVLKDRVNFIEEASECQRDRTMSKGCALRTLEKAAGFFLSESEKAYSQYCTLDSLMRTFVLEE